MFLYQHWKFTTLQLKNDNKKYSECNISFYVMPKIIIFMLMFKVSLVNEFQTPFLPLEVPYLPHHQLEAGGRMQGLLIKVVPLT